MAEEMDDYAGAQDSMQVGYGIGIMGSNDGPGPRKKGAKLKGTGAKSTAKSTTGKTATEQKRPVKSSTQTGKGQGASTKSSQPGSSRVTQGQAPGRGQGTSLPRSLSNLSTGSTGSTGQSQARIGTSSQSQPRTLSIVNQPQPRTVSISQSQPRTVSIGQSQPRIINIPSQSQPRTMSISQSQARTNKASQSQPGSPTINPPRSLIIHSRSDCTFDRSAQQLSPPTLPNSQQPRQMVTRLDPSSKHTTRSGIHTISINNQLKDDVTISNWDDQFRASRKDRKRSQTLEDIEDEREKMRKKKKKMLQKPNDFTVLSVMGCIFNPFLAILAVFLSIRSQQEWEKGNRPAAVRFGVFACLVGTSAILSCFGIMFVICWYTLPRE